MWPTSTRKCCARTRKNRFTSRPIWMSTHGERRSKRASADLACCVCGAPSACQFAQQPPGCRRAGVFQDPHRTQGPQGFGGRNSRFQLGKHRLDAAALLQRRFVFEDAAQGRIGQFAELFQFLRCLLADRKLIAVEIRDQAIQLLSAHGFHRMQMRFQEWERPLGRTRQRPHRPMSKRRIVAEEIFPVFLHGFFGS